MIRAVMDGDARLVKTLLAVGADPDAAAPGSRTPLLLAVLNDNIEITNILLASGAQPDTPDRYGDTALHQAACKRRPGIVKTLLDNGAHPGLSPGVLKDAVYSDNLEIVQTLLTHGAHPGIPDNSGFTTLHQAGVRDHPAIVQILHNHIPHRSNPIP